MQIEITIKPGTPSSDWAYVANKRARQAAAAAGVPWTDAEVYVVLPEGERCMTKAPGYTELVAHG